MANNNQNPNLTALNPGINPQPQQAGGFLGLFRAPQTAQGAAALGQAFADAPGLAQFYNIQAANMADQSNVQNQQRSAELIAGVGQAVKNGDYKTAASLYSQLDPEGFKAIHGQLAEFDPSLAQMKGFTEYNKTKGGLAAQTEFGVNARQLAEMDNQAKAALENAKMQMAKTGGSEFTKEVQKAQAKDFAQLQDSAVKVDDQLNAIDDAINSFVDYKKNSRFGTGPIATLGGLTKYVDEKVQTVDSKFKLIALKNLTSMFAGMSKAIDSDAERAAFEATQPSLKNDDKTNAQVLLGAKAISLKNKAEAAAQQAYVADHGSLDGYKSPILGKVSVLVDPQGEFKLVSKDQIKAAQQAGYQPLDKYGADLLSGRREYGIQQQQAQQASPTGLPIGATVRSKKDGKMYQVQQDGSLKPL